MKLDKEKTPKTCSKLSVMLLIFYSRTIFHRMMDDFMNQGGGHKANLNEKKTRENIEIEADNGLKNNYATVALAR